MISWLKPFNISWIRVKIFYYRLIHLAVMFDGDLTVKIGWGVHSHDLMEIERNCLGPYKVNSKFLYEGTIYRNCLIYKVNFTLCGTIHIVNTQQMFKKIMNNHFSNVQRFLKNRKNQTHSLPIIINTLNLPRHTMTCGYRFC